MIGNLVFKTTRVYPELERLYHCEELCREGRILVAHCVKNSKKCKKLEKVITTPRSKGVNFGFLVLKLKCAGSPRRK